MSFYLIEELRDGKQRRSWLHSIDHTPTDWVELRFMLEEVMLTVYIEHVTWDERMRNMDAGTKRELPKTCEAMVTLEHHLPGGRTGHTYGVHGTGYRQKKIATRREYEGIFRLAYNSRTGKLAVKDAQFGPKLGHLRTDYWRLERGIEYRVPPLIPEDHRDPLDVKGMIMENPMTRYADYSRKETRTYAVHEKRSMYSRPQNLMYVRERKDLLQDGEEE